MAGEEGRIIGLREVRGAGLGGCRDIQENPYAPGLWRRIGVELARVYQHGRGEPEARSPILESPKSPHATQQLIIRHKFDMSGKFIPDSAQLERVATRAWIAPQDIDGLLAWAAGADEDGLHVVYRVAVQGPPGTVGR